MHFTQESRFHRQEQPPSRRDFLTEQTEAACSVRQSSNKLSCRSETALHVGN